MGRLFIGLGIVFGMLGGWFLTSTVRNTIPVPQRSLTIEATRGVLQACGSDADPVALVDAAYIRAQTKK